MPSKIYKSISYNYGLIGRFDLDIEVGPRLSRLRTVSGVLNSSREELKTLASFSDPDPDLQYPPSSHRSIDPLGLRGPLSNVSTPITCLV